jgi:hypothetical protein
MIRFEEDFFGVIFKNGLIPLAVSMLTSSSQGMSEKQQQQAKTLLACLSSCKIKAYRQDLEVNLISLSRLPLCKDLQ